MMIFALTPRPFLRSVQNKLDIMKSMMDCLYAKCVPIITDCVMAELEKMGRGAVGAPFYVYSYI